MRIPFFQTDSGIEMPYGFLVGFRETETHSRARDSCHMSTSESRRDSAQGGSRSQDDSSHIKRSKLVCFGRGGSLDDIVFQKMCLRLKFAKITQAKAL